MAEHFNKKFIGISTNITKIEFKELELVIFQVRSCEQTLKP